MASSVAGINASGAIAGNALTGFLYSGGTVSAIPNLGCSQNTVPSGSGWNLTCALGINDSGRIIGKGTFDGQAAGFLLDTGTSAAPEPAPVTLLDQDLRR